MKVNRSVILSFWIVMVLAGQTILANADSSVPPLINYQGQLTDASGTPQTGTKKLEFNIYDASSGGNKIWGPQTFNGIPLIGGRFNVMLGSTDAGGNAILSAFGANSRFLGIKVDDGAEITPRQQILSTPFAIQAARADYASDVRNIIPTGTVVPYTGTVAPAGWLICDGSSFPRSTYSVLFAVIGTTYGSADGSTFRVPDFRRRVPVGAGGTATSVLGNAIGNIGGEESHTLNIAEMPSHNHSVHDTNHEFTAANTDYTFSEYGSYIINGGITGSSGGGQPHNNIQPSLVVNFIIKY